jgi:hypothetical protein
MNKPRAPREAVWGYDRRVTNPMAGQLDREGGLEYTLRSRAL